jgi:hypothetical protein
MRRNKDFESFDFGQEEFRNTDAVKCIQRITEWKN